MQIILREADRLSSLVSNFLLYADAGRQIRTHRPRARGEGNRRAVRQERDPQRPGCNDPESPARHLGRHGPRHLRQVLWNLLINAAEAIEGRGQIRLELSAGKDRLACLKIADSGVGMPPEIVASIFDPFFTTKAPAPAWVVHCSPYSRSLRLPPGCGKRPRAGDDLQPAFPPDRGACAARQLSLDRLCRNELSSTVDVRRFMLTRRAGRGAVTRCGDLEPKRAAGAAFG